MDYVKLSVSVETPLNEYRVFLKYVVIIWYQVEHVW